MSGVSVFNLITTLCERYSSNEDVVKKLRSTAFEILLKKRTILEPTTCYKDVIGADPYTNLLAWGYTLASEYGLVETREEMKEIGEYVHDYYGDSVIAFLMHLRTIPQETTAVNASNFDLPESFTSLFKSPLAKSSSLSAVQHEDSQSVDIWELASREAFSSRKNWEHYGQPEPDKEKLFLSEITAKKHLWVDNLPSEFCAFLTYKPAVKSVADFVKDLKYALVGLASYSFVYNDRNQYTFMNVTVEGFTMATVTSFARDFMEAGWCYRSLDQISTRDSYTAEYKQKGYVFAELCQSIQRYLAYFRAAVMSLSNQIGLLELHERTREPRSHLEILAAICRVGPYQGTIPHGVELLNHLYRTAFNLTEENTLLVLYSVLFPCCQVYISRFVQQWLLEGTVSDPYEEFFIRVNYKYISSRGRTYWTRSFSLVREIVPDFLGTLLNDILLCGKTMNLLKLCNNADALCSYLSGEKPLIFSCCLTSEQLAKLEQNAASYYFEALALCGPILNLEHYLNSMKYKDEGWWNLVARKRALTLERIELERKRKLEAARQKKLKEITELKEQYDSALLLKQQRIASEIEAEMRQVEFNLSMEHVRDRLIEKEAKSMIEFYNNLYDLSDKRRCKIEKHISNLKIALGDTPPEAMSSDGSFYSVDDILTHDNNPKITEIEGFDVKTPRSESSSCSAHTAREIITPRSNVTSEADTKSLDNTEVTNGNAENPPDKSLTTNNIHSKSLDLINANESDADRVIPTRSETFRTFEMAQKIKEKVLWEEMGIAYKRIDQVGDPKRTEPKMTEAQRNKLRVMGCTEFAPEPEIVQKTLTQCEINRNFIMGSSDWCYGNDNEVHRESIKKSMSLQLEVPITPTPMSVDSTPLSTERTDFETGETQPQDETCESCTLPAAILETDAAPVNDVTAEKHELSRFQTKVFSKRVTKEEASGLSSNCLKLFLRESIAIPLNCQTNLVQSQLLKYFVMDLGYLKHLNSLRDYFFLQDGEFGRNITENLFEKLYDAKCPIELINCKTLQTLVFDAVQRSNKYQENAAFLSFKMNEMPHKFNLADPDVLNCLSLTYKITWPLNVILPVDVIAKYDEVFKYLLKLNRISWVLKRMSMELKQLGKMAAEKEIYLMVSPQFRKIHQCRHVILHFVQTFQNYIVGEVIQSSWEIFERDLTAVKSVDALYTLHATYIKTILFLCLLNQKNAPLKKALHKIFVVILKFYDYSRAKSWKCEDGVYVHPNFEKLETIFANFEELVLYLFKTGKKVAKSGYQPHLTQLLDMLDINGYYSKKICSN